MKIRKDLIVVALATFCLTATLFMVVTTKSADSPNWDPWADIKEDGTVDIYDAITLANAFGSSGTTPKDVNVTNWPLSSRTIHILENYPLTWNVTDYPNIEGPRWIEVGNFPTLGYSRMKLYSELTNCTNLGIDTPHKVEIYMRINSTFDWGSTRDMDEGSIIWWQGNPPEGETVYVGTRPYGFETMYAVVAPYYYISLYCDIYIDRVVPFPPIVSCNLSLGVYLSNE
jgi:hypothetical protein